MTDPTPVEVIEVAPASDSPSNPNSAMLLSEISDRLAKGEQQFATVRTILSWFGAKRRGYLVIQQIESALNHHSLVTDPPFDYAYIDAPVEFHPMSWWIEQQIAVDDTVRPLVDFDPSYRVGRLAAANRAPVSVKPDEPLANAVTIMLRHDFSQLPVMTTERIVKGMISWRSIGARLALGKDCEFVRDCIEKCNEVELEDHIFEVISLVVENDCVIVRNTSEIICGLITASDLGLQFKQWAEPFMLLGEIENHLRRRIDSCYTTNEIQEAKNPNDADRKVESSHDLTFGEYVRLLESRDRWAKFGLKVDRESFIRDLKEVNEIRNGVMHFDPDGIDPNELDALRRFRELLAKLEEICPCSVG